MFLIPSTESALGIRVAVGENAMRSAQRHCPNPSTLSGTLPWPLPGAYVLALRPACANCIPATLPCS